MIFSRRNLNFKIANLVLFSMILELVWFYRARLQLYLKTGLMGDVIDFEICSSFGRFLQEPKLNRSNVREDFSKMRKDF